MPPDTIAFVTQFAASIGAVLGCHDRVIFKGYLPFGGDDQLNRFVDHGLKMRRKDFLPFVEEQSEMLVAHAKTLAEQASAAYHYFEASPDKEALLQKFLRERPIREGLVAVLCCKECDRTVKLLSGKDRPRLAFRRRPHRVLYFYFLDPDFGLMHVRLQTWFPYTVQVYVNGHEWLARQMVDQRLGFVQQDNAFTQLDDPGQAQQLADGFPRLPWVEILNRWVALVHPLLGPSWLGQRDYYWVIDQAEYRTDVRFRDRDALTDLYPRLLDHALLQFSASDLLTFLGRRLHPCFDGEVVTICKKDRQPGARIKQRVKNNWLKMYDKFALLLRIETVINQPREFKVRRLRTRQGKPQMVWCPMNKGVANFYHDHEVARAANERYLNALAVVNPPSAAAQQVDRVSASAPFHGRQRRGLNLLRVDEQKLFRAVLRGEHRLHGLRNRDLARELFGPLPGDVAERRRRTAKVSRLLQLLRAQGLIAKVPHSHRYQVTTKGEAIMSVAISMRHKVFPTELDNVA